MAAASRIPAASPSSLASFRILETDDGDVSRVLKEAVLEGEAAGVLEAAAKLLKAYKDELPESALQILAMASGLPEPQPAAKSHAKEEGAVDGYN